jgi:precorrin-2 methylase
MRLFFCVGVGPGGDKSVTVRVERVTRKRELRT